MSWQVLVCFQVLAAAAVGCAVRFGPGDYGGGGAAPPDAAPDADAVADGAGSPPDAGPGAPPRRLLVLAGEKDGADTATSDVWVATIESNGDVGKFEYLQPGLFRGPLVTANVSGGRLFVVSRANGRSVEHAAVDAGLLASPWEGEVIAAPGLPGYGQVFSGSSLLALGGAGDVPDENGETSFVRDDAIRVTPFDGDAGTFGEMSESPTKLPTPLHDMAIASYKDFVYVVGGHGTADDQRSKVYVGPIDPLAGVGPFTETAPVLDPQSGQPHTPASPIVCAGEGHMFIAGGTTSSGATDIVLAATIDEATGSLAPWRAVTKLPGPLRAAGCAIWDQTLHLIGGIGTSSRTDRIIRARIAADGSLGEWELSSGERLPASRSSIIAVTF